MAGQPSTRPDFCQVNGDAHGNMEVLCWGNEEDLNRPCVDCGLWTGRYCDFCLAADRIPKENWIENQHTPLCSKCDNKYGRCHFCRGQSWATRPPWRPETVEETAQPSASSSSSQFRTYDAEQLARFIAGGVEAMSPLEADDIQAFMEGLASVSIHGTDKP